MKSILIFGCNGFIGSSLVKKFDKEGYEVYGCDIDSSQCDKLKLFFKNDVLENEPHKIFAIDYTLCVNCAGSASVPFSFNNPFHDYELNTRIVFRILNELWKKGSKTRFINLSSAAVYGNPIQLPLKETDNLKPISPYGNHKLMSEIIVNQFKELFHMDATSLRIFSAYGPGLKKQIFWDIYQKSLVNNLIEMHGTGNESRDFIYIEDLIQAIYLVCITNEKLLPVYNIANGVEITIKEIVELFCKYSDASLSFKFNGVTREGDPVNWRADVSNLANLGYKQEYSIENGIEDFVKWTKNIE